MSSTGTRRGLALPATGTLVVLAAALCALWLGWNELCTRGLVPGVAPPADEAVVRMQTVEALVAQGADGVPVLVEAYSDPNPKVRRSALLGLGRIGTDAGQALEVVRRALRDPDPGVRSNAAYAFARILPHPDTVGAAIGPLLADSDGGVREQAAQMLRAVGPFAVRPAVESLRDQPAAARMQALFIIRRISWNAVAGSTWHVQDALRPAYEWFLDDPDKDIRIEALMILDWVSPAQARELLLADYTSLDSQLIGNPRRPVEVPRRSVDSGLNAVARLGPHAAELLPDVLDVLEKEKELEEPAPPGDPREFQRTRTCIALFGALAAMRTSAKPAIRNLQARVGELRGAESRLAAAETLFAIGGEPDQVAAILVPLLSISIENDFGVRSRAAKLLAKTNPAEARRQVEKRLPLLKDPDTPQALFALEAISGMAREAQAARPVLIGLMMRTDKSRASRAAAYALAGLRADAAPALPALLRLLDKASLDDKPPSRALAPLTGIQPIVLALGRIGPASRPAVPRLLELLAAVAAVDKDDRVAQTSRERELISAVKHSGVHGEIVSALGLIGDASAGVIAAINSELRDGDARIQMRALRSLMLLTPESPALLKECLGRLADQESAHVRADLILMMGKSKADRSAAIGLLTEALGDEAPIARAAAAMALGEIGPAARAAIPELRRALADQRNWLVLTPQDRAWSLLWPTDEDTLAPHSVEEALQSALARIDAAE